MYPYIKREMGFIGNTGNKDARLVIVGVPLDLTGSFRRGTASGPGKIREVSINLEEYSPFWDQELAPADFYDTGDILLPPGNLKESLERIEKLTASLLSKNKLPFFLGGEHLITYPIVKSFVDNFSELAILHFDAHADLREKYEGEALTHATVMRRICEIAGSKNVYQFGIRSGCREEWAFAQEATHFYPEQILVPMKEVLTLIGHRPVYVTLDIDVVDPAFAPGTGTPEPGGCTSQELIAAVHQLSQLNIVGIDLVEVAPNHDLGERTALLAAKVIREFIIGFSQVAKNIAK
jgi:agmatinase